MLEQKEGETKDTIPLISLLGTVKMVKFPPPLTKDLNKRTP